MPKVVTNARQLRFERQAKLGRSLSVQEVADETGIARTALTRIELNQTERIDFDTLQKLCAYYNVSIGEMLTIKEESEGIIFSPVYAIA